jgi:hypothetical protein
VSADNDNFDDIVQGQFDDVEVPDMDLDLASEEELMEKMQAISKSMLRRLVNQGINIATEGLDRQVDPGSFFAGMIYSGVGRGLPPPVMAEFLTDQAEFIATLGNALPPST